MWLSRKEPNVVGAVKDFIDETVWRDNKGIINRDRKTQKWDYEHWYRKPAVKQ
ncbi:hypothetical protein ACQKP8_11430 [Photobacterium alginatilyticum]|uniref:hypothetical protein n=1 Tax=Photobacterium alginatilyticum TaxID=1775171 RepID=UPI0040688B53